MDNISYLKTLYPKLVSREISDTELQWLLDYFDTDDYQDLYQMIRQELDIHNLQASLTATSQEQYMGAAVYSRLTEHLPKQNPQTPVVRLRLRIGIAAAILLITGASLFYYTSYYAPSHPEGSAATRDLLANDIKPGTNKAILTLANGQQIILNDAANGTIANQSGIKITKTANGQVIYTTLSLAPSGRGGKAGEGDTYRGERGVALNTITTPRGGQYQIILPDGSKVWLNASSSLKYPLVFSTNERRVELVGEGYFEISHNKHRPFRVVSKGLVVEVLGTHFNVNTYGDLGQNKTTLLEGSVRLDGSTLLSSGQQAIVDQSGKIRVHVVDTDQAVAWMKGYFNFDGQDLESIMLQVSRWYDVEVIYQDKSLKELKFAGTAPRFGNVSEVIRSLELTGAIHLKIEGRKIIISK